MISLVHTAEKTEFEDKKKEKKLKPNVVHYYNNIMGGVDKVDQHITYYLVARKRDKIKYYQNLFFHLLDQALYNSFVIHNLAGGAKNNMNYRITIVEQNKPNVQLLGPRRPSVSLLSLTR
ncbi:piggyBac transposable element-derived protein 4 [Trichonephila inaurata madagascariensis]|uniref:PiggyBac transposable element-derived protein 4 n=1 Tax=Trichonephila inaurata madagascariensis TaxID=2747483 RepID=A0A8X6WY02_9ARAC|nr:piggyBac transposable element-derived protein 4 [Trichonephila inaurata madagascariensis]